MNENPETTTTVLPMIEPWIQLGATGILGFCFLAVLKWMMRQQSIQLNETNLAIHTNSMLLLQLQKELLRHDATVRGINPAAGETLDERSAKAVEAYNIIREDIDKIGKTITSRMEAMMRAGEKGKSIFEL